MTNPILDDVSRGKLIKEAMPHFRDLAYMPVRRDLGLDDDASAIAYDTVPEGPYGSRFGNAVGGHILGLVLDAVGAEAFVAGQVLLARDVADHGIGWSDRLMYERRDECIGYGSTNQILAQLDKVFPGFPEIETSGIARALYDHAVGYAFAEIALAEKDDRSVTKRWSPERDELVQKVLDDRFTGLVYGLVQDAMAGAYEVDVASVARYEGDGQHPYDGSFGNEVGGHMLEVIIEHAGDRKLLARRDGLAKREGDRVSPLPSDATDADFAALGKSVASAVIAKVSGLFPEVPATRMSGFAESLERFATNFARDQSRYVVGIAPRM